MKTKNDSPRSRIGFTLIELLVVVAIIAVLLALLMPALDQAVYQAELTVCGARTRAIALGALNYAQANRRAYPYREGVQDKNTAQWQPHSLNSAGGSKSVHDDRPLFKTFLALNDHLNDPLTGKLDFDASTSATYASYALWFDWRYRFVPGGGRGMHRIGDRFEWNDRRYNLLASDNDGVIYKGGTGSVQTSHADKEGKCYNQVLQDGQFDAGLGPVTFQLTISVWRMDNDPMRGDVDLNFAYDDASVERKTGVDWEGRQNGEKTMDDIPEWTNRDVIGQARIAVPRAN